LRRNARYDSLARSTLASIGQAISATSPGPVLKVSRNPCSFDDCNDEIEPEADPAALPAAMGTIEATEHELALLLH
jgi:hypothetical protein